MNSQQPGPSSFNNPATGGGYPPAPRQEMEYLCAGELPAITIPQFAVPEQRFQIAVRKTRSDLESRFVAGSVVIALCTKRGQREVRIRPVSTRVRELMCLVLVVQFEAR